MIRSRLIGVLSLFLIAGLLFPISARPAAAESGNLQTEVERLIKMVEEQGRQIDAQQKKIDELSTKNESSTERKPPETVTPKAPAPQAVESTRTQQPLPESVGRPPENPEANRLPEIATILEQPGVLTPKGTLVLEPSLQYSHSSSNRIALYGYTILPALTIGVIDVREINSDNFVAAISARYGLTNRLEVEAKVPFVFRTETTVTRPINYTPGTEESVFDRSDYGLGDIEVAARYQLNQPSDGPIYIANLRVKSPTGEGPFDVAIDPITNLWKELPTGSGFWGIQPGLTVIYPTDPAVFFGGISYLWQMKDSVGNGRGDYDPGDVLGVNFGMGQALNEKASFSIGYEHNVIATSRRNGDKPAGDKTTHVGSLLLGYSYKFGKKTSISLSIGIGVTNESPDVQLTLRVPFSF